MSRELVACDVVQLCFAGRKILKHVLRSEMMVTNSIQAIQYTAK